MLERKGLPLDTEGPCQLRLEVDVLIIDQYSKILHVTQDPSGIYDLLTHPIMAGKHEVIRSLRSIPKRVFGRYYSNIISYELLHCSMIISERLVDILDHPGDTERHEINMGVLRISGLEPVSRMLHLVYEPPFYCVYVFARPVMDNR